MFDMSEMQKRVDAGLIKRIPDPMGTGLSIYDYTMQCTFERAWDDYTLSARGLVLDDAGHVWARPFRKFFNYGEPGAQIGVGQPEFFEKYDGSLIIVFVDNTGRWRFNTRGSWQSEQAIAANKWMWGKIQPWFKGIPFVGGVTYCMEYVAPDNRIVVPYSKAQCIMLAAFDNASGMEVVNEGQRAAVESGIAIARSYGPRDLSSFDPSECDGHDHEGYVAVWPDGKRVKLKFAEYLRLHKVVTGLSVKGIWEGLRSGNDDVPEGLPDEFMEWFEQERDRLQAEFNARFAAIESKYELACHQVDHTDRKAFALFVQQNAPQWALPCLFQRLDGKPYADTIWKQLEPKGKQTWKAVDE